MFDGITLHNKQYGSWWEFVYYFFSSRQQLSAPLAIWSQFQLEQYDTL
jgi:hypothetical protein